MQQLWRGASVTRTSNCSSKSWTSLTPFTSKAVFGITEVADLSPVEFETQFLGAKIPRTSKRQLLAKFADVPVYQGTATSVDWTATLTTPIKD